MSYWISKQESNEGDKKRKAFITKPPEESDDDDTVVSFFFLNDDFPRNNTNIFFFRSQLGTRLWQRWRRREQTVASEEYERVHPEKETEAFVAKGEHKKGSN
jgi:hypothetical protein